MVDLEEISDATVCGLIVDDASARGREGGDKRCDAGAFVGSGEEIAGWWKTER
jgi:hypothetical protein